MFWLHTLYDDYINLATVNYFSIRNDHDARIISIVCRFSDNRELVVEYFESESEARNKLKEIMKKLQEAQ